MAKARVCGCLICVLCFVLMSCGPAATPTPTPVEWIDLAQATNLSALSSYRARYAFRWEGMRGGQQQSLTWDILQEVVREPPARRFLWSEEDAESGGSETHLIQIGQQAYINPGSGWTAVTGDSSEPFQTSPLLATPLSLLASGRARLVQRNVTINSVSANRYVVDEASLGPPLSGEVSRARGDVWVSTQHNVVVKYEVHCEGINLALVYGEARASGESEKGVLDAAFDLVDINQPIIIQSPQGSTVPPTNDIPILEDATGFTAVANVISYRTARPPAEVTAFYQAQMPARGWIKTEGPSAGIITFARGRSTAQVVIESAEGKTAVMIMTTE